MSSQPNGLKEVLISQIGSLVLLVLAFMVALAWNDFAREVLKEDKDNESGERRRSFIYAGIITLITIGAIIVLYYLLGADSFTAGKLSL